MEMNIEMRMVDRFINNLLNPNKTNTIKTYRSALNSLYEYLTKKKNTDDEIKMLKSTDAFDIEDYFKEISNEYKKSTINAKIEVIRSFFEYLIDANILQLNPTKTLKQYSPREVKRDQEERYIPTIEEVKRLINITYEYEYGARKQEFANPRNRFLIALLSTTGLRIEEALGIKMEDIEIVDGGYMINIHEDRVKNSMQKRVPIVSSVQKYFVEYCEAREIENKKYQSDLLFFSNNGKKLTTKNMNQMLEKLCDRVGIEENITNHCFRHFLTQELIASGCDTGIIYKILGWVERGIITNYQGTAADPRFDNIKLEVCDVLK